MPNDLILNKQCLGYLGGSLRECGTQTQVVRFIVNSAEVRQVVFLLGLIETFKTACFKKSGAKSVRMPPKSERSRATTNVGVK